MLTKETPYDLLEKEFLEKYDNGEYFTEKELKSLVRDFYHYEERADDTHDSCYGFEYKITIFEIGSRYFLLKWGNADDESIYTDAFDYQPYEVVRVNRIDFEGNPYHTWNKKCKTKINY